MRNKFSAAAAVCSAIIGLFSSVFLSPRTMPSIAATESRAECVAEVSSRRFLEEKNADVNLPMASTTKILTAIMIIDDCNLDEEIAVPRQAEGTEGSSVYLRAGEIYSVRDLLYGLMLRSGNDCAVTLALHHSGTIEKFARRMNEKAISVGAEHSRFVNPHGLPDSRHYTTARDLALISAYALENETFREIVSCKFYEARHWQNKNKMLWTYDGAIGVKTGFTVLAGRCLVTSAERNGMKLVCVVLNSPQMFERTAELLNTAFANYKMETVFDNAHPVEGLRAEYCFSYPLSEKEMEHVSVKVEKFSPLPEKAGEIAGELKIFLKNDLLFSQNLYMIEE